ncbi:MAG: acyltransferase [Steroidobacteraceae bacterium]
MNPLVMARRFLVPSWFVTLYGLLKWGVKISTRAEVELSPLLRLGKGTVISSFAKFKASEGLVQVGLRGGFAPGCFVSAGEGGIVIGDNAIVGPNVVIVAHNYRYDRIGVPLEDQGSFSKGIRLGSNVWIGANSTILDGAVIGDNCIVVAGSVVNRRFPSGCIIQGNPARILLNRERRSERPTVVAVGGAA